MNQTLAARLSAGDRLRFFDAFVEQSHDAVLIIETPANTARASIVYANAAFERVTGYRAEEIYDRAPIRLLLRSRVRLDAILAIRGAVKMCSPLAIEFATQRKDGAPLILDLSIVPIFDDEGTCPQWIALIRDMTARHRIAQDGERRQAEEEMQARTWRKEVERDRVQQALRYLTFHDVLTGLPNRSLLLQHVASALLDRRSGTLLSIQLEQFESIAGALGRRLADELLTQLSKRVRTVLHEDVALARLETGSFAAWVADVWEPGPVHEFVDAILAAVAEPFVIDYERIALRAHIGIASAAPGRYNTPEELLRDAEIAAQAAVKAKARYRRFSPPLHEHSLTRLRVEFQLHRAVQRRQFVCHFQPVVSLDDNRVFGFEALVRWQDPERGLIPPDVFIPIAEETGHIVRIGELVMDMACREAARWPRVAGTDLKVNVNVSARQLDDEHFAEHVLKTLRDTGLSPDRLCLEITETAFAQDENAMSKTFQTLREAGVCIGLDDFGVGYSSLASLRRFPFNAVKIDRSFISANSGNESEGIADESIVRMIVALAHARWLQIAAEGVETTTQFEQARILGCTHAQGFFIAHPMPAEAVAPWLEGAHERFQRVG